VQKKFQNETDPLVLLGKDKYLIPYQGIIMMNYLKKSDLN